MVSDGMSQGVPSLAEFFSRTARSRGTRWYELLQRTEGVVHGLFETHALNSMVTDSAAASTAWASGTRVFNGALNVLPDGRKLTPVGHLAPQSGRRVGLVTTTTITHATPAGFAAIETNRDREDHIAPQYLDTVDVLLGGGRSFFDARQRGDKHDLIAEYVARGYTFWDSRAALLDGGQPQKVLGLFWPGHLPHTIDRKLPDLPGGQTSSPHDGVHDDPAEVTRGAGGASLLRRRADLAARVPTLAEMTQAALNILAGADTGFLLQVEGGRIDHAAHANDAGALLWEQLAFDDALEIVLRFAEQRSDTLVIVTSDHGNSNPGLNGMGSEYRESDTAFARLATATRSYEALAGSLVGDESQPTTLPADAVVEVTRSAFGFELSVAEVDVIRQAAAGRLPPELNCQHRNFVGVLGQVLGNHTGIGWTGVSHTEDLVLLTALGPGADRFAGLLKNTDAFERLTALMGIAHRNPQMSADDARTYLAAAPTESRPHWS